MIQSLLVVGLIILVAPKLLPKLLPPMARAQDAIPVVLIGLVALLLIGLVFRPAG